MRRLRRAAFRYLAEDASPGHDDAADRLVRALREAGVHVEYSRDAPPTGRAPRGAPTIAHFAPDDLPAVRAPSSGGPLISYTDWETDRLPQHWPEILNQVDRVMVPTESARELFVAGGVTTPIVVLPHVAGDPVPGDGGAPLGLAPDLVVFYTIGRWGLPEDPAAVLHAFLAAFTADDRVALVVKTTPTTMLEVAGIMRNFPSPPIVRIEIEDWAPERIAGLHCRGDCYVSLSRGAGWGLNALDAAGYGNPVVLTGWGEPLADLETESAYLVDFALESVRLDEPRLAGSDERWAVPRVDHATELLRQVAADLGAARRRAAPLRSRVLREYAPARVAGMVLDALPELATAVEAGRRFHPKPRALATPSSPGTRSRDDDLLLVGVTAGAWRSAFDNWVEMADRYGYRYELVGRDWTGPYVPHATKWQLLRDYFASQPRTRLVFYLDAADAFVCDGPAATLARFRSYGCPLVVGAEHSAEQGWRNGNTGAYVGEAGVIADALRDGIALEDWERYGHVCDQHAMLLYFNLPENRHQVARDHRRVMVQNVAASERYEEFDQHRLILNARPTLPSTSSVHFYGDNGRGYNAFARLYGLTPQELQESGRFRVPM